MILPEVVPSLLSTSESSDSSSDLKKIITAEQFRVLGRDPAKYLAVISCFRAFRGIDQNRGLTLQAAYYSLRFIDDAIDGDMYATDPKAFAQDIREQIASDELNEDQPISRLIKYAIDGLKRMTPEDDIKGGFLTVIDAMVSDFDRAEERRVLTKSELDQYYWDVFAPGYNFFLIATGSRMRIQDISELPCTQARLNSIRDLKEDWLRGIINIPAEILKMAELTPDSTIEEVEDNPIIQLWIQSECNRAKKDLKRINKKIDREKPGKLARVTLWGIVRNLQNFADN